MIAKFKKKNAASIMEYMALIMFFTAALLIFQFYIVRALAGNWKRLGDSLGYGKQYDPRDYGKQGDGKGSLNCFWDKGLLLWISARCFATACETVPPPADMVTCKLNCSQLQPQYADCADPP